MKGSMTILPIIAVVGGVYLFMTNGTKMFSGESGGCGCGCKSCKDEERKSAETEQEESNQGYMEDWQGESYPAVFDPVHDFLPRYRFPSSTSWSKAYNPADPYRPLDYQSISIDEGTRCKEVLNND